MVLFYCTKNLTIGTVGKNFWYIDKKNGCFNLLKTEKKTANIRVIFRLIMRVWLKDRFYKKL